MGHRDHVRVRRPLSAVLSQQTLSLFSVFIVPELWWLELVVAMYYALFAFQTVRDILRLGMWRYSTVG